MIQLDQANFNKEVISSVTPVLVDFWAPWCGPCRMVAPIVEEISTELSGKLTVGKVNVDENQDLASQYGVMSIPTLCLYVKGSVVAKIVGFRQKKEILTEINKHI